MQKVHSKINPGVLLSIIFRKEEMMWQQEPGIDITPESEFLQVRSLKVPAEKAFRAHKHFPQQRTTEMTQESLVIIQGVLEATIYDLDDKVLDTFILKSGDCIITLKGGHSFKALEENTSFYEHKNGPYYGLVKDKEFIGEEDVQK